MGYLTTPTRHSGRPAAITIGLAAVAYWALLPSLFGELVSSQVVADAQLSAAFRGLDIFWDAGTALLSALPAALPSVFALLKLLQMPVRGAWLMGWTVAGVNALLLLGDWPLLWDTPGHSAALSVIMELLLVVIAPVFWARWLHRVLRIGSGTDAKARGWAVSRTVGGG